MIRRTTALLASLATLLAVSSTAMAAREDGPSTAPRRAVADELLVGFEHGASDEDRARAARRVAAVGREAVVRGRAKAAVDKLKLRRGSSEDRAIATLEDDPAVAYAEPNWILTKAADSDDPYFTGNQLWGTYGDKTPTSYLGPSNPYGSQAAEAWGQGITGSPNVVVGVIDEGIMHSHDDLAANAWANPNDPPGDANGDGNPNDDANGDRSGPVQYTDDLHGWDFYNDDNTVFDGNPPTDYTTDEHGTHVAGTIGAKGGNGRGVAGVNWNVSYVSGKFLGPDGGYTDDAIRAVDYMTDLKAHGANVVATNNSWGGGGYSQGLHDAVIRGAKAGVLFVAAAGNEGRNNDRRANYPSNYSTTSGTSTESGAGYDAVIAVAAINKSGGRPTWSNYGKTTVDLGAPGDAINSTVPPDSAGTAYWSFSGTSMATPHVAGTVALYAAKHYPSGVPDAQAAERIRSAILGTTVYTSSLDGRTVTKGRLNASAALAKAP